MKEKRGQAAMEFLMTYGWAILAAVIVIAVLAYFGVFSPSTYVPNSCSLSAPWGCNAGTAKTTGVTLELINGAGESLNITGVSVAGCTGAVTGTGTVLADAKPVITVACTLSENNKFKGDITVTYKKAGSAVEQTSSGSIVSKVTA